MTQPRAPRQHDEDFKSRAVQMVLDGRSVNQVARDLDIHRSCLQRWKRKHLCEMDAAVPAGSRSASELAAENDRLRKELAYMTEQRDILKKSDTHLRQGARPSAQVMESLCQDHRVSAVCEALGMSRSGHYARSSREPSRRSREDRELGDSIERIYREHRCVYGYPRMRLALRAEGLSHGRRRIARLMAERSLKGRRRGRFKPSTTDSSHGFGYGPNVLAAQGSPSRPHEVWVSDTTSASVPLKSRLDSPDFS